MRDVQTPISGESQKWEVIAYHEATAQDIAIDEELKTIAKQSLATQNEFLARLLTISTALLGGGLVLAKGDVLPHNWAVATMVLLFASLGMTLYGLAPNEFRTGATLLESKLNYMNAREAAGIKKTWCTKWSAICFVAAMLVGVLGVAFKGS